MSERSPAWTRSSALAWRLARPVRRRLLAGLVLRSLRAMALGASIGVVAAVVVDLQRGVVPASRGRTYVAALVAASVAQLALAYAANVCLWPASYRLGERLRTDVLSCLPELPMGFHAGPRSDRVPNVPDILTALTQDVENVEDFLTWTLPGLVGSLVMPIALIATLLAADVPVGLAAALGAFASAPVFRWARRRYALLAEARQELQAEVALRIAEHVQGTAAIRAFRQERLRRRILCDALDALQVVNRRICFRAVPASTVFVALLEMGVPALLLLATYRLTGGRLDATAACVVLVLVMRVYEPLRDAAARAEVLPEVQASIRRLTSVLDEARRIQPRRDAAGPGNRSDVRERRPVDGFDVVFENVDFSYRAGLPVFSGVTFTAPQQSMTAIVGPSAAGKTTILHLAARLWDPDRGAVRVGGVDLRDLSPDKLSDLVSVVFEDAHLFSGTIYENIALGRPGGDPEAVHAAVAASCRELVTRLPAGYETVVGAGGLTLSDGQRRCISIARAILRDAPVVLLDELPAAMDVFDERLVQSALASLAERKTLLVVTRRPSTLRSADRIVLLDRVDGRPEGSEGSEGLALGGLGGREGSWVAESGTHEELLAARGSYARLWSRWERAAAWRISSSASAVASRGVPLASPVRTTPIGP